MTGNDDFGELLIESLREAVAYEQGRGAARVDRVEVTARTGVVSPPPRYSPERIRAMRHALRVSQPVFAGMLNVSDSTVRAWEQGAREPEGPSLRLLEIAETHPEALLKHLSATRRDDPSPE